MIFNKYFLFFCAGYLTIASAVSTETEAQRVRTGFKRLVKILNKSFDESCKIHVTGEGVTPITPTTTVYCGRPGGYAILTAEGGTFPIPKELEVCGLGTEMKSDCKSITFTGNIREDLQNAYAFLHGLVTRRDLKESSEPKYEWLVKLLNETHGGSCQIRVAGTFKNKDHKEKPTTFVDCVSPGGEAVLTVKGNVPKSLELCGFGDEMKTTCTTIELSGNEEKDRKKVSEAMSGVARALEGGHIVGTDYDMLVELLNGAYDSNCRVRVTGMRPSEPLVFFVCSRPGGYASLTSKGATHPVPTKFSVCEQGDYMQGKCDSVDLTGETTKDIPAVKKVLGISI